MNLAGCAEEIQHRLIHIFSRDENGRRAVNAGNPKLNRDPHFRDYVHFYEVCKMTPHKEELTRFTYSSSMETTVVDWELPIKQDGQGLSLGASCKPENTVVCPGRLEVSCCATSRLSMQLTQ